MTTIEIIFTLALLAGFVGLVIDMERRAARENKDTSPDNSITLETVEEVLHKIGIKKMEPQQGKNIAFNYQNSLY